ncbi:MAG: P27 family phage terminase small subunit [Planctomycetes bacterium]|nr:P27 family phage terminase small subunit [Planctomycetota bacterium]
MARGRKPTSKSELQRRGSWRAKGRADDLSDALIKEVPNPPTTLTREAGAEWKRIVAILGPRGVLTKLDRAGLTMLCEMWAEDRELSKALIIFDLGTPEWRRIFTARSSVRTQWTRLAACYGLTPSDRARIKIGTSSDSDVGADSKSRFFPPSQIAGRIKPGGKRA